MLPMVLGIAVLVRADDEREGEEKRRHLSIQWERSRCRCYRDLQDKNKRTARHKHTIRMQE